MTGRDVIVMTDAFCLVYLYRDTSVIIIDLLDLERLMEETWLISAEE